MKKNIALIIFLCTSSAQAQPFSAISGRWANDVQITAANKNRTDGDYWWVGQLYGLIEPSGRMAFKAANGCEASGLARPSPFASGLIWEADISLTKCPANFLNRRFSASLTKTGDSLRLNATSTVITPGQVSESYEIKATLSRY